MQGYYDEYGNWIEGPLPQQETPAPTPTPTPSDPPPKKGDSRLRPDGKWETYDGTAWVVDGTQPTTQTNTNTNTNTTTTGPQIGERRPYEPAPDRYFEQWDGTRWVRYDLPGSGREGGGTTTGTGTGGQFDTSGFAWPRFNAPTYSPGPGFAAPPPFTYDAFAPPKPNEIFNDPSYTQRRDEGLRAIEHSAAAKGLTRLPATVQALGGWNQDFASREYGNIFDRAANTYDRNRRNAADTYATNYGVSRDVWDRGNQQGLNTFDRNYKSAFDQFNFNEWQPSTLTFEDMYRRYRDQLNSKTQIATAGAGR